uniref:Paralemmin-1 n=1 Tax=Myripristis murdjan TaxID=586833 RepID=A0A667YPQ7_9TELE
MPHQEKRKWQTEIENKKRQLEDDRRALQHLKSKALRERWLLDGAPSAGPEQDEVKKQLEEGEAKTRSLEETISRLEQELVNLETGGTQIVTHTTVIVHEMNGEDGVHLLSSSEVDDLINKAGEASMLSQTGAEPEEAAVAPAPPPGEITGVEARPGAEPDITEASTENPVTMVFMGYQSVEDEAETKKVLGLQGTVKAELVLIEDGEGKTSPRGSEGAAGAEGAAPEMKGAEKGAEPEGGTVEISKEKQPCKCCTIM